MEPRPLNKPQRPSTPQPAPSVPPVDRGSWTPPAVTPPPSYSPPPIPTEPPYSGGLYDSAAPREAWYESAPAAGPPIPPQGYSPGPALTPIDAGRGSRLLGPLLALGVLAAVVIAVVFVIIRVFGDDDGRDNGANLAAATGTAQSQAAPAGVASAQPTAQPTDASNAVAGADETGAPAEGDATQEQTPEPSATPADAAAADPTQKTASARSMLPTTGDLPAGFQRTEDDKRVKEAVAASFADSDEATAFLDEWEWRENAYRTFEIPADAGGDPNGMTYINISIHRFGTEEGAKGALTYFADDVISTQGLEEFEIDRIGEQTRALMGAPDGANLVVLYIRTDKYLIRIGGSSPQGDPTEEVIAMAEKIVA